VTDSVTSFENFGTPARASHIPTGVEQNLVTDLVTSSSEKCAFGCEPVQSAYWFHSIVNKGDFNVLQLNASLCGKAQNQFRKLLLYTRY
jgi:hypothetical protein